MALFVAAADESVSGDGSGEFYFGGFVAPERDWSEYFAPAWNERVLEARPKLRALHMSEIKSSKWRRDNGISDVDAERKIGEAFRVIRSQGSLYPICFTRFAFSALLYVRDMHADAKSRLLDRCRRSRLRGPTPQLAGIEDFTLHA